MTFDPLPSSDPASSPLADMPGVKRQTLLALAQGFAEQTESGTAPTPLKGRVVGVIADGLGQDAELFCDAVRTLGGRVAHIRPDLDGCSEQTKVKETARMLGRLYAAVEAPNMAPDLREQVHRDAAIPVYDGLSSARHPLAQLASLLRGDAPLEAKRRWLLQAALMLTIV